MKGYGLPRSTDVAEPDVGDIKEFGLHGSAGHLPGKGGDIRSYFKNVATKGRARRRYKRKARTEGKTQAQEREE